MGICRILLKLQRRRKRHRKRSEGCWCAQRRSSPVGHMCVRTALDITFLLVGVGLASLPLRAPAPCWVLSLSLNSRFKALPRMKFCPCHSPGPSPGPGPCPVRACMCTCTYSSCSSISADTVLCVSAGHECASQCRTVRQSECVCARIAHQSSKGKGCAWRLYSDGPAYLCTLRHMRTSCA